MKKKILSLCLLISVLTGCQAEEPENKKITSVANGQEMKREEVQFYDTVLSTEGKGVKESQKFDYSKDSDYYITSNLEMVDTKDVYYFIAGNTLMKFDKKYEVLNVCCSKPECNHTNRNCNSFFESVDDMFCYEGDVYVICTEYAEGEDSTYLVNSNMYKMSLDTDERELVKTLKTVICSTSTAAMDIDFAMDSTYHRGYLYYVYSMNYETEAEFYTNKTNHILRYNMKTGELDEKAIAKLPYGSNCQYANLRGYGSYVYYTLTDDNGMGELYRFNVESLENEKIELGMVAEEDIAIYEGKVLYKKDWEAFEIYLYDPNTKTEELFYDFTGCKYERCLGINANESYVSVFFSNEKFEKPHTVILDKNKKVLVEYESFAPLIEEKYLNDFLLRYPVGIDVQVGKPLTFDFEYLTLTRMKKGDSEFDKITY